MPKKAFLWPAWRKSGTDVYLSSWWDSEWQIYDHYWTPKNIGSWWESKKYDWVFVQEIPYDLRSEEFVWDRSLDPSAKTLRTQHWRQKTRAQRKDRSRA